MSRPALTITSANQPDPSVVAEAAVALILDFHAKTSRLNDTTKKCQTQKISPDSASAVSLPRLLLVHAK